MRDRRCSAFEAGRPAEMGASSRWCLDPADETRPAGARGLSIHGQDLNIFRNSFWSFVVTSIRGDGPYSKYALSISGWNCFIRVFSRGPETWRRRFINWSVNLVGRGEWI